MEQATVAMVWLIIVAAGVALGAARGGALSALTVTPFRGLPVLVSVALSEAYLTPMLVHAWPAAEPVATVVTLTLVVTILVFILFNWATLTPWPLWIAGVALNGAFVLVNGGRQPVLSAIGLDPTVLYPAGTLLPWLGAWLPLPFGGRFSVGDVIIAVALILTIQSAMRRPPALPAAA